MAHQIYCLDLDGTTSILLQIDTPVQKSLKDSKKSLVVTNVMKLHAILLPVQRPLLYVSNNIAGTMFLFVTE